MATAYSSNMQIKNKWGSTLTQAWLQHVADGKGEETLAVTNVPVDGTSNSRKIDYYSGIHDYWTLTFQDQTGRVWGSDLRIRDAMPNNNVSMVTVTVDANGSKMTIDIAGKGSEDHPISQRA